MRPIFLHELDSHEGQLVSRLLDLPHKILSYDDLDGIQQLVLYELAHDQSFGLSKASYLIDNPEFNCLKGVAGYDKTECAAGAGKNPWDDPKGFIDAMKDGKFHQQVASFMHTSLARTSQADLDNDAIAQLSKKIGMDNSSFVTWPMRHGNHGILLFEEGEVPQERRRELLQHFVALLGLC
jgi:hypothetical protein